MFDRNLPMWITSLPTPVIMAGFEATTTALQNNGWQISMEKYSRYDYYSDMIRFAFKHDGIKQMAIGYWEIERGRIMHPPFHQDNFKRPIHITHIAPMIECIRVPVRNAIEFQPIDAMPDARMTTEYKSLNDIAYFKPIKTEDFEIYIHQKDEKEILDMLLKKQDPKQKEIIQNRKREMYRQGNGMLSGDSTKDVINSDIKAQLVICA